MAKTKVSKDNLIKVFDYIRCSNGVTASDITKFMGWTNPSTQEAIAQLVEQGDITEIVIRDPGVTKEVIERKGYIVE